MTFENLVGYVGLAAIAACWVFAVILYRVAPAGSVAHKLAFLLVVEGFTLVTAGFPERAMGVSDTIYAAHPMYAWFAFLGHTVGDAAMLALYPPFFAVALQTPLTRPFARDTVRIFLTVAAVVLVVAVQLTPFQIGATILYVSLSALFGFALLASIDAWRAASGASRARAKSFTIAFGVRDICWGFVYAGATWQVWTGTYTEETDFARIIGLVYALGTLLAVPLIAYGILRAHLFDIDLRVRWTIKQSTLAAMVVTVVFLVSEGADRLLSEELGNWVGLLAAAVVVFLLAPLQRFAENVASAAMPNTTNTPEYAMFRKMQVYEEAVAEARFEGGISDRERALLVRLRDSLGIAPSDAEAIEADLAARNG